MFKGSSSFFQRRPKSAAESSFFGKWALRIGGHAKARKAANLKAKNEQAKLLKKRLALGEVRRDGLKAIAKRDFKDFDEYGKALRSNHTLASIHGIAVKAPAVPKKPKVKKKPQVKRKRRK